MSNPSPKQIILNGLWKNNPGLIQLLGLCPLLAVTTSLINGFALGLATLFVLISSNVLVASLSKNIPEHLRMPFFVLVIASFVTIVQMYLSAYHFELYESLGIFLALITTNCMIMGRAEGFARKNAVLRSALDGLMNGLGFLWVLCIIGGARELLGQGTLFANADMLFGPTVSNWHLSLSSGDTVFLLAILPPGAFILLGFLIALQNIIREKSGDT